MTARPLFSPALPRTRLPFVLLLALLAAASGGCAPERASETSALDGASVAARLLGAGPTAATPSGSGELQRRRGAPYPLAVGNRWEYEVREKITLIPTGGPTAIALSKRPWVAEIIGTQQIGLRDYFLQTEYNPMVLAILPGPMFAMRQDRTGLYNLDLITANASAGWRSDSDRAALRASLDRQLADSPDRESLQRTALQLSERLAVLHQEALGRGTFGSGGADPGEITLLRYPLFTGARWIVRQSPRFARRVIGRERLELPAGTLTAWKLRGASELYGPNDQVHFWYAHAGLVRILLHAESQTTDVNGNVTGVMIGEWDQVLTQAKLLDPGGPHKLATAGGGDPEP